MKALISTLETRLTGYRVAELVADNSTFPVADTMFWVDFPSNLDLSLVSEDKYWYDPLDQTIKPNFTLDSEQLFNNMITTLAGETPY
jgi:hypothetical protein